MCWIWQTGCTRRKGKWKWENEESCCKPVKKMMLRFHLWRLHEESVRTHEFFEVNSNKRIRKDTRSHHVKDLQDSEIEMTTGTCMESFFFKDHESSIFEQLFSMLNRICTDFQYAWFSLISHFFRRIHNSIMGYTPLAIVRCWCKGRLDGFARWRKDFRLWL